MADAVALTLRLDGFEAATVSLRKLGADAAAAGEKVAKATQSAAARVGDFGKAMSAVTGIAGAATAALSIVARNNEEVRDTLEKVTVAMSLASAGMRGLGAAARFVVTPVGLVVTAISAAIAVFVHWEKVSSAVVAATRRTWQALGEFFGRLGENLANIVLGIMDVIGGLGRLDWKQLQEGWELIKKGAGGVKDQVVELGTAGATAVGFLWDKFKGLLGTAKETEDVLAKINASHVAAAQAAIDEYEAELKALEKLNDQRATEEKAAIDAGLASTLAAIDAAVEAYEEGLRAEVAILDRAEAEKKALIDAGLASRLAAIDAEVQAYEDALRAEARIVDDLRAKFDAIPEAFRTIASAAGATAQETMGAWSTFSTWFGSQLITWQSMSQQAWQTFSQGVGQAFANAIVFGKSLTQSFGALIQQIAAMVIQMLVQMALQAVLTNTIAAASTTARATVEVGAAAVSGGAWAWAASIKEMGLPGIILGAVVAAGVIAAIMALLGQITGSAHGGLENVPETGTFLLKRGERVLSPAQNRGLEAFMAEGGGGGGGMVINVDARGAIFDEITYAQFIRRLKRDLRRV